MKSFIHDDFMLTTEQSRRLFHEYAENLPIIDYHCHLSPEPVARDHRFRNLTEIWLAGDHYKWRAMRTAGVPEERITGPGDDYEKFVEFARVVPRMLRNPMYHWTHMELRRPFGVTDVLLSEATAASVWQRCNALLAQPSFSARGIMKQMNVECVCTTDDPIDSLEHHAAIRRDASFAIRVLPTWRPDKGMAVENSAAFNAWIDKLAAVSKTTIRTLEDFLAALDVRHTFFHEMGCRLSDHGLETMVGEEVLSAEAEKIFVRVRANESLTTEEVVRFKSYMMHEFAVMDFRRGWTQQIHYGAIRNNNSRMMKRLGPDTGFDSIADGPVAKAMNRFLDGLEQKSQLPKTILYCLNPGDQELLATTLGNFMGDGIRGKLQLGSGWWFLDNIDGMTRQLNALSSTSLLSGFVGMLTDSRSFLSYTRHEYFRRLLCEILGGEMASGVLPNDFELVGSMVSDISYRNASTFFGFGE